MIIRQATYTDLQAIADIHLKSWKDAYANVFPCAYLSKQMSLDIKKQWREIEILGDDVVLVAEKSETVGFIAVWCRPDPFIDNLHVKPACRSQKIGLALMEKMARRLLKLGKKTAYLWVFLSNKDAIRFYEKLGGVCREKAIKTIFGHKVPSVKIKWEDISVICGS